MDKIDQNLAQLPYPEPDDNLHVRILEIIQRRKRRRLLFRRSLSGVLAVLGVWLALPAPVSWLDALSVPESGLPYLVEVYNLMVSGFAERLTFSLDSILTLPAEIASAMGASTWIGFAFLAAGAFLVLDQFLPEQTWD